MFRLSLFICCCLLIQVAYSQQKLKGRVYENKTRIPLAGIKIQNINSKQLTVTDTNGRFTINAAINDLLVLNGFSYQADTVMLTDLKEVEIFMEPQKTILNEVKVITPQIGNFQFYDPDFHGQTVAKLRDAKGNFKGGIAIRLWGSNDKRKREKIQQMEADDQTQREIAKTFSPANLAKYIPLKDSEMSSFITRYMPTAATFRSRNFNLPVYLNDCYKEFMKLSPENRTAPDIFHIKP